MQNEIVAKVLEVVESNLPKVNGDLIKDLVIKYEEAVADLERSRERVDALEKELKVVKAENTELKTLEIEWSNLKSGKKLLAQEKRQREVTKLKHEIEMKDKIIIKYADWTTNLTKNVSYRERVYGSKPMKSSGGYYNQESYNETRETDIE